MKFFLDFFPIVVFVGVYFFSAQEQPMYPAVIALMIATLIQNIGTRLLTGKFEKLHLWTLLVTLVFGAMTLAFRQPAFIFWKASILVWITALVFLYRQHIMGKILLQEMFEKTSDQAFNAPAKTWQNLNHIWAFSYIIFGFLNIYVAYEYSEAFWVKFKLFGLMGLNFALLFYIIAKLYPYFPTEEETELTQDDE